ncbi:MAG: SAM-dependent methyltransferase, partial [Elusimicrobia bacterium CG08_land_8_20_14_0_20_59_10]
ADAKNTGLPCGSFDFAVCNNLVHHIAEPGLLFREIARLLRHGGGIFIRDLRRPRTARELAAHMANCSGDTPRQRELLRDSLLAALRPEEVAEFVKGAGLRGVVLAEAGDRHWELRRPAR